jgi:5-formyltetrahydrofolate cyclo-ligase
VTDTVPKLRKRFRARRRALTPAAQLDHAERVARAVVSSGAAFNITSCGIYFAFHPDGELDTLPLLSRMWSMSKTVACPVIGRGYAMDFYRVSPTTRLVANRYGIFEPATRGPRSGVYLRPLALSTLFMPLVAFDETGTRLGMGAGYYDRYIGRLSPALRPLLIGLAHEVQRSTEPLERQVWDVPLDAIVTESGWQALSTRAKVSPGH